MKNEYLNKVILESVNTILENNSYLFKQDEWDFILSTCHHLIDCLQAKGNLENEDLIFLYENIRKIKNMHLKDLNEKNFKKFIKICEM